MKSRHYEYGHLPDVYTADWHYEAFKRAWQNSETDVLHGDIESGKQWMATAGYHMFRYHILSMRETADAK